MKPSLYSVWHLNLMYSSIEIDRRAAVIEKCFWPLIDLAKKGFKPAIEAPAITLEIAQSLDPKWIAALKDCIDNKQIEFVGSGYSQLIATLVPARANKANIREGSIVYKKIIGQMPDLWMANEQTFSRGLAECLLDENINSLLVDWSNPFSSHPEWNENYVFSPQKTLDSKGRPIRILWSDSLAFQKFQRCVHLENVYEEYESFLNKLYERMSQVPNSSFCIYGNDAEIFDFRPGRFKTEPSLKDTNEWQRIFDLMSSMREKGFEFIHPSDTLKTRNSVETLELTTLKEPNSVKKQPKYNVTRWALTGRGSAKLNQTCWNLLDTTSDKEICELWSSDYRTHITEARWNALQSKLVKTTNFKTLDAQTTEFKSIDAVETDAKILFKTDFLNVSLNPLRGLSVEDIALSGYKSAIGRLEHGNFSRIDLSADWYSGNTVLQLPGKAQATDLKKTEVKTLKSPECMKFQATSAFGGGHITKTFEFMIQNPVWFETFQFQIPELPIGSLRFGFITFKKPVQKVNTHLGGTCIETFDVPAVDFDHGAEASSLVSSNQALGMTENIISIETADETLTVEIVESSIRPVCMVENKITREGQFFRVYFSLSEYDETRRGSFDFNDEYVKFRYSLEKR